MYNLEGEFVSADTVQACNLSSVSADLMLTFCSLLCLTVKVFSTCTSVGNFCRGLLKRSVACPGLGLARLWCHDHLFKLISHGSALGALSMSAVVCLSWTCSFSMSMVSRSLAYIIYIYWELHQKCKYFSKVDATSSQHTSFREWHGCGASYCDRH